MRTARPGERSAVEYRYRMTGAGRRKVGQALADVATIGLLHERNVRRRETVAEQLQAALNSRVIIEQASRPGASRTASQRANRRRHDAAIAWMLPRATHSARRLCADRVPRSAR